jgi:hypothetical protein
MIIFNLEDNPPFATNKLPSFTFTRNNTAPAAPTQLYPTTAGQADLIYLIKEIYRLEHGKYPNFNEVFEFTIPFRFTTDFKVVVDVNGWDLIDRPTNL